MKEYRVITDFFAREAFWHAPQKSFTFANAYREDGGELVVKRIKLVRPGTLEQFHSDEYVPIPGNQLVALQGEMEDGEIIVSGILDVEPEPTEAEAAFLEGQLPDSFTDKAFGTFYQNIDQENYHGEVPYQDGVVKVYLESETGVIALAWMHEGFDTFMQAAKQQSARELLDLANDWGLDGWDEEEKGRPFTPLTEEDFIANLSPMSIYIHDQEDIDEDDDEDGEGAGGFRFSIDYMAGEMFWGHNVNVEGLISDGAYNFTDSDIWG